MIKKKIYNPPSIRWPFLHLRFAFFPPVALSSFVDSYMWIPSSALSERSVASYCRKRIIRPRAKPGRVNVQRALVNRFHVSVT